MSDDAASALRCNGCGAGLVVPPGADRAKCTFCGMEHSLRSESSERPRVTEVEVERIPSGYVPQHLVGLTVERALLVQATRHGPGCMVGCLGIFLLASVGGMVANGHYLPAVIWGSILLLFGYALDAPRRAARRRIAEIDKQIGRDARS